MKGTDVFFGDSTLPVLIQIHDTFKLIIHHIFVRNFYY